MSDDRHEFRAVLERPDGSVYHSAAQGEDSAQRFAEHLSREVPSGTVWVESRAISEWLPVGEFDAPRREQAS
jgi:hypothetical protein